jgi:hypothetical protein
VVRPAALTARAVAVAAACALLGALAACGGDGDGDLGAFCDEVDDLVEADPFAELPDEARPADLERAFDRLRDRARAIADAATGEARPLADAYADAVASLDDLLAGSLYRPPADELEHRERVDEHDRARDRLQRAAAQVCPGIDG